MSTTDTTTTRGLPLALQLAGIGYAAFPLKVGAKAPAGGHGFLDASTDASEVLASFGRHGVDAIGANVGIACGAKSGGLIVIDCDVHAAGEAAGSADGLANLAELLASLSLVPGEALTIETPTGGQHHYYVSTCSPLIKCSAGKLAPAVDVRSDGGYIVAPGSVIDGNTYHVTSGSLDNVPPLPKALMRYMLAKSWPGQDVDAILDAVKSEGVEATLRRLKSGEMLGSTSTATQPMPGMSPNGQAYGPHYVMPSDDAGQVATGSRNDSLFRLACSLRASGIVGEALMAAVAAVNSSTCRPPLPMSELRQVVASALRYRSADAAPELSWDAPAPVEVGTMSAMPQAGRDEAEDAPQDVTRGSVTSSDGTQGGTGVLTADGALAGERRAVNGVELAIRSGKAGATVLATTDNVAEIIKRDEMLTGRISYDRFRAAVVRHGGMPWDALPVDADEVREWSNADDAGLDAYLCRRYGLSVPATKIAAGLTLASHANPSDRLADMLDTLPEWDGRPRAACLFVDFLGAEDSEYVRAATLLWLREAVRRAKHPGCKADYMLILQGRQGLGKSYILQRLAMASDLYNDNLNTIDGDKAAEKIRGFWIVELAELLAVKKTREVEALKAFVTSQVDSYRSPYARLVERHPRCCVFAGTTNESTYLSDRTGNRRFLPIHVGINNPTRSLWAESVDDYMCQVWAEVLANDDGAPLVLPKEAEEARAEVLANAEEEDERVGMVAEWLAPRHGIKVCSRQIMEDALGLDERTIESRRALLTKDIAAIMDAMPGWRRCAKKARCGKYGVQRAWEYVGSNGSNTPDISTKSTQKEERRDLESNPFDDDSEY